MTAAPFRFEDLNGKPEPESWGPTYPKTASAAVERWRKRDRGELTDLEKREYGASVSAWIRSLNGIRKNSPQTRKNASISLKYRMPDYRAQNLARLMTALNGPTFERSDEDRLEAYEAAPKYRLPAWCKPKYVRVDGEWRLTA